VLLVGLAGCSGDAGSDAGVDQGVDAPPADASRAAMDGGAESGALDARAGGDARAETGATSDAGNAGDGGRATDGGDAGDAGDGWSLVWADEFNAADGTGPDPAYWSNETGGTGWGNQEREFYTAGSANAEQRSGSLWITARRETPAGSTCWYGPCQYTSARLVTRGHFTQRYGRFEASIQIPRGQGLWPAFWMLGDDIGSAGWPTCGEIDIMENIGREPARVHGTIHGPGYSGAGGLGAPDDLPDGGAFADGFHVFAVEWEPTAVRWLVDGHVYETRTPADLPAGTRWVFDHPFFLLLNVAVGGGWPGDPDGTTTFPQTMRVDYVRVYTR
jgi:beta-glucanase (GH16 family)